MNEYKINNERIDRNESKGGSNQSLISEHLSEHTPNLSPCWLDNIRLNERVGV